MTGQSAEVAGDLAADPGGFAGPAAEGALVGGCRRGAHVSSLAHLASCPGGTPRGLVKPGRVRGSRY